MQGICTTRLIFTTLLLIAVLASTGCGNSKANQPQGGAPEVAVVVIKKNL